MAKKKKKEQEIIEETEQEILNADGDLDEMADEVIEEVGELSEVDVLTLALETAQAEAAKNLDGWQRTQAEFQNSRTRQERERQQMHEMAVSRVIKRYLDVADDLERALNNKPDDPEVAEWSQGIELVYRKILTLMENEGVAPMEALGVEFDPMKHEAIMQEESDDYESGQVMEVMRQGFTIGERVIRPALVKVAS